MGRFRNAVRVLLGTQEVQDITAEVFGIGGGGRRHIDHSAEASIDYMACELAKMRPVSALPVHVYEKEGGARERSNKRVARDLDRLLTYRWNELTSASAGIRWVMFTRDTLGTAYVRVEWKAGRVKALYPVTCKVTPQVDDRGRITWKVHGGDRFTKPGTYLSHELLHFTSPAPKTYGGEGRSLAEVAMSAVGLSIDLDVFYSRLLNDGNHFPGWLETTERLSDADKNELKESLQGAGGIIQSGKARLFPPGVTYHQVPLTMAQMDLTAQQTWVLDRICAVMGVPPTEVGDLSHSTYSNTEQQSIQFAQKTLMPEVRELEIGFQPIFEAAGIEDCYVRFALEGLLRGTYKERMDGYRTGIYAGFFTRNEVRAMEEMPALPGLDDPLQPTAYMPINDDGVPVENTLMPVYTDMAQRVAERFKNSGVNEKTKEFAVKVLKPYADACLMAGIEYDLEKDIDQLAFNQEGIVE